VEEGEREAFRRRLGWTLGAIRRRLTPYSQQSIADVLGVDTETLGRWERGLREPKVSELVQLWRRYDVPAEWLLDPTDSITELDRRIGDLRARRLREAAAGAAQVVVGEGTAPPGGADRSPRRGRRPA
jgi:transcriptional regulator with XRE-family HTH domain